MSKRGWLSVAILAAWAATLGFNAKRLYSRSTADLLAEAARTIPPGTAYYAVFQGDRHIGWAQTDVDTLPEASGFLLKDQLVLREAMVPGMDPMQFTIDATLGPTFTLRSFRLSAEGVPGIRQVRGEVRGDSALDLRVDGPDGLRKRQITLDEPIVVSGAWPLRLAVVPGVEPGSQFEIEVYDPMTGAEQPMRLRVLERRVRSFPDSVTVEDGRWVIAREDSVMAWRVEHEFSGLELEAWVDEDGRLLESSEMGGLRLVRTAFELAYYGEAVPGHDSRESQR